MKNLVYCQPTEYDSLSTKEAIRKKLETLFDALDHMNSNVIEGLILDDVSQFRQALKDGLEKQDGYIVTYMDTTGQGTNKCHVYPPETHGNKQIRKIMGEIESRE